MKTRWAALIGHPVEHSLSPLIYRSFAYALEIPLHYSVLDIRARKLESSFRAAKTRPWVGWNVTLPHKVALLDLADEIDPTAKTAGATNLIAFSNARAKAYNTDVAGFLAPLHRRGLSLNGKDCVVLGAGGAARAVGAALRSENAANILFVNRTPDKAESLAEIFSGGACAAGSPEAAKAIAKADYVVNATSVGLTDPSSPISPNAEFKTGALAYDLIYRPALTPFLKTAKARGAGVLNGLEMLVSQACAAWHIWFNEEVPADIAARVLEQLENKLNEHS